MTDLYRYRDLIWTLVIRELKVRYRRSAIGFLWTMLQPLLTLLVLQMVFSALFRFDIQSYPVYALAGIVFWNFFSQSIIASMNSLKAHAGILQKLPVPLDIFPITAVASGVVNLVFALVPLFAIVLITGHPLHVSMIFIPVAIAVAALFTLGAGYLLSPLAVFFSDVIELVTVLLTLLFYMTPIFWPLEIVQGRKFYWVLHYNPLRSILEVFRDPIYHNKFPPLTHFSFALVVSIVLFIIGYKAFRRSADRIPFYV